MQKGKPYRPRQRSHRVAWPEPGHENGGEFRITLGRLVGIVSIFVTVGGAFPLWWTLSDHWMNKAEIQKEMKLHADHDEGVQKWTQYGLATNRLEYIDDKMAECEAKKMVRNKIGADEIAMCARYEAKQKAKQQEAQLLKEKAQESTKEKR